MPVSVLKRKYKANRYGDISSKMAEEFAYQPEFSSRTLDMQFRFKYT